MKRRHEDIELPHPKVSTGLHLIQEYDDDDCDLTPTSDLIVPVVSKEKLKSPFEILNMFQNECHNEQDEDVSQHGGRIRSFAHVRGNWASFIALPSNVPGDCENIITMCQVLSDVLSAQKMLEIDVVPSPHVSLSKTLVFRHHWLEPFIQELKGQIANFERFMVCFDEFEVYINDEKTRTFIGMKIYSSPTLTDLLKICDSCLTEYKLESYYKDPSFHISLAWIVGDHVSKIKEILSEVNKKWKGLLQQDESLKFYNVTSIEFKYGNKIATFNLH